MPKCPSDLYDCPCPPTRDRGIRLYSPVVSYTYVYMKWKIVYIKWETVYSGGNGSEAFCDVHHCWNYQNFHMRAWIMRACMSIVRESCVLESLLKLSKFPHACASVKAKIVSSQRLSVRYTFFYIYKHLVYKHAQPQILENFKHMVKHAPG